MSSTQDTQETITQPEPITEPTQPEQSTIKLSTIIQDIQDIKKSLDELKQLYLDFHQVLSKTPLQKPIFHFLNK